MSAIVRLVVIIALRDRLFSGLAGLIAVAFAVSLFLGGAALIEQTEAATVYAAGASRIAVILGLVVFISFQTQRLFESREIEAILSRAVSRPRFVLAYWAGFGIVAATLVVPLSAIVLGVLGVKGPHVLWCASLLLECLVVLGFTLFAALSLERATTTIFVTGAFYVLTRLMGFFLGIRDATPDSGANRFVNPMLDALALVVPRVDLMTQSRWLVYGLDASPLSFMALTQAVAFIALALAAAAFDLRRKQF